MFPSKYLGLGYKSVHIHAHTNTHQQTNVGNGRKYLENVSDTEKAIGSCRKDVLVKKPGTTMCGGGKAKYNMFYGRSKTIVQSPECEPAIKNHHPKCPLSIPFPLSSISRIIIKRKHIAVKEINFKSIFGHALVFNCSAYFAFVITWGQSGCRSNYYALLVAG